MGHITKGDHLDLYRSLAGCTSRTGLTLRLWLQITTNNFSVSKLRADQMHIDSQGCNHRKPSNIFEALSQASSLTDSQSPGNRPGIVTTVGYTEPNLNSFSNPHWAPRPLMQHIKRACYVYRKLEFKSEAAVSSTSKGFGSKKGNNLFARCEIDL